MAKFTFIREDDDGEVNATSFEADVWYTALSRFINFLRGSGYHISNNSVGINTASQHYFNPYESDTLNLTVFEQD